MLNNWNRCYTTLCLSTQKEQHFFESVVFFFFRTASIPSNSSVASPPFISSPPLNKPKKGFNRSERSRERRRGQHKQTRKQKQQKSESPPRLFQIPNLYALLKTPQCNVMITWKHSGERFQRTLDSVYHTLMGIFFFFFKKVFLFFFFFLHSYGRSEEIRADQVRLMGGGSE